MTAYFAHLNRELPMPNFSESLLARLTDPDRAAAIYGDLTELAATRGRLWFWLAYTRTVVALGWRTPAAIVVAILLTTYLRGPIAFRLTPHWLFQIRALRLSDQQHPYLSHFCWTVSLSVMFCAWIVFPYVAVRFGLRNRLTYLSGLLLLFATPVDSLNPRVYEVTGLLVALIIVAALASPLWRWQMIFFAANIPIYRLAFYVCVKDPLGIFHPHHHLFPMDLFGMRIDDPVAILLTVVIGPPLYRWLLQPRSKQVTHA
jgi:hypothetical protein